ncbi:MAG: N-formylglutamate amidohydrolase [Gammaproteobacteria bacterium]
MDTESSFLLAHEPPPFTVLDVAPVYPALLVCDHATNLVPARLDQLGVSGVDLTTHFALDVGAADVTRALSAIMGLPAVLSGYSRLVVDCNRHLDDSTAFALCVEDILVPGNQGLTHADRQARADALYWPYHRAIRDQLTALEAHAPAPALIAVHSFTPMLNGEPRPWDIGILWDKDPRIPVPMLEALAGEPGIVVGDNEPYSGKHPHDFTVDYHAEEAGLPHVSIEIRQDLVASGDGAAHWAGILAEALIPILVEPDLYTHWAA